MAATAFARACGLAACLLGWWLASKFSIVPYLPSPAKTVATIKNDWTNLRVDLVATAWRALSAFLIGSTAGVLLVLVMAASRYTQAVVNPLTNVARTIPGLALLPLALLWFGTGSHGVIALTAAGCFFPMIVVTAAAARNVPRSYTWAAASLGATHWQTFPHVVLPAIVPGIIGGLRVSIVLAIPWAIGTEVLGASSGLGVYLWHAQAYVEVDRMIAVVLFATVLVVFFDLALRFATRRATVWTTREE